MTAVVPVTKAVNGEAPERNQQAQLRNHYEDAHSACLAAPNRTGGGNSLEAVPRIAHPILWPNRKSAAIRAQSRSIAVNRAY